MNGKIKPFMKTELNMPPRAQFIKSWVDRGITEEEASHQYDKLCRDIVYVNSEYQVNIDKKAPHGFDGMEIWHLSIKRLDREPIHDWRDLQQIKNMLVGEECECLELYPAESRKVDSANQFHLWALVRDEDAKKDNPMFPVGWTTRLVMSEPIQGAKQRAY